MVMYSALLKSGAQDDDFILAVDHLLLEESKKFRCDEGEGPMILENPAHRMRKNGGQGETRVEKERRARRNREQERAKKKQKARRRRY